MVPTWPPASSMTQSFQVPFMLAPLVPKTEAKVPLPAGAGLVYGPASAGPANVSVPLLKSVGLKSATAGQTAAEGIDAAAASRIVMVVTTVPVRLLASNASDMITNFCPPGPSNKISISPPQAWLFAVNSTEMALLPVNPETTMFDEYGVDGPFVVPGCPLGISNTAEFVKAVSPPGIVPRL